MKLFLDSSALAKRYIAEKGSETVDTLLKEATLLGISVTSVPEIVSALCRKVRERFLNQEQYEKAKRALLADVADAEVIHLVPKVLANAVVLLEKNALRAMDALQIGGAAEWGADLFVTSDKDQFRAATWFGLKVERV